MSDLLIQEPKKPSKKLLAAAVAVLALGAAALALLTPGKYQPKYKAGDCVLLQASNSGFKVEGVNEKGEYEGVLLIQFMIAKPVRVEAKQADEDIAAQDGVLVSCETGEPLEAQPEASASPSPEAGE